MSNEQERTYKEAAVISQHLPTGTEWLVVVLDED
jgi:hypothetical protein